MVTQPDSSKFRAFDRVPPQHVEAEESILGGILFDPNAIERIADFLPPQAFYLSGHQEIYRAALALHKDAKPCDVLSVCSYLSDHNLLKDAGGQNKLIDLVEHCFAAVNIDAYAELVLEKYKRRTLIQVGQSMIGDAFNAELPWSELQENVEQQVFNLFDSLTQSQLERLDGILNETFNRIERLTTDGRIPAIPTQFYDLDGMLGGGLQPGQLVVIGGRPGMGKTAFSTAIACNIAAVYPVAVFSLEMDKDQLACRFLSAEASIESGRIVGGRLADAEWLTFGKAMERLSGLNLYINDCQSVTPSAVLTQCRRLKLQQGGLGLVVIDYLHLMLDGNDDEVRALGRITRDCKKMARELQCPVILLSQLNRAVEGQSSKRPSLKDLRQSGAIEQDADIVLLLYRDEYYNPDTSDRGIAEVIVAKHRNGPTGTVKFLFEAQFSRFRNLVRDWS